MNRADPEALFRDMLGQWEAFANQFGTDVMKTGEFARVMQGATAAGLKAQEAAREAMAKMLAAANMPTREDVIDLAGRVGAVEARLERIEALLSALAAAAGASPAAPAAAAPRPKRTRKPPPKPAAKPSAKPAG